MADPNSPTFHLFPCLPLELRQQIWELSIELRTVAIAARSTNRGHNRQAAPSPPLLLACAESRAYGKTFYTKAILGNPNLRPAAAAQCYRINFSLDEVYMADGDFLAFSGVPLVQRLTLVKTNHEFFLDRIDCAGALGKATALEKLTIMDCEFRPAES